MTEAESNRETELKLAARPEDLAKLMKAQAVTSRAKGKASAKALESAYFDTPDQRLAKRLVSLRVRRSGDGYVQTVKSAPMADGMGRGEWEGPVTGPEPDLSLLPAEALEHLGPVGAEELRLLFASHVQRTTRDVAVGDGEGASFIELAFDKGEIRTPDGEATPLCEVELELKRGSPAALYELALELAQVAPLRLEPRSKAARGYALLAGEAPKAVKAAKLELPPGTTVEGALSRILRSCLDQIMVNEACVLFGGGPEGVHQMRVGMRRLRSALTLFRPFLPSDQYNWIVGELKWLGSNLGPARDWDVFLAELLAPVRAAFARDGEHGKPVLDDIDALAAAACARRDRAYEAARGAIRSDRYTQFLLRAGAWLESRGWRAQPVSEHSARLFEPVEGLADQLLAKRHKKARQAGRGFADLPPPERHEVRILLKKLRYTAEFFRSLYDDKAARRYIQNLAAFQDVLGHLNDVATATRLLHELHDGDDTAERPGEPRAAGIVIGWHARGLREVEPELLSLWSGFCDVKPFWSKPERSVQHGL